MYNYHKDLITMARRGRSRGSLVSTAIENTDNSATNSNTSEVMAFHGGRNSDPLTGYGHLSYIRERSPPTFDDKDINWPKYAAEFRLHLLDQNESKC